MRMNHSYRTAMYGKIATPVVAFVVSTLFSWQAMAETLEAFTEPYQQIAVPAAEIGVIESLLIKEGDAVAEKQLLGKLDDAVLRSSLEVAASAMNATGPRMSAEAEYSMRKQHLLSYQALQGEGNATSRELSQVELELQQAAARLQIVREDLELRKLEFERVKQQIQQRKIISPIDGIVVSIDKQVGEFVSPTDPTVLHIVQLTSLRAVFSVPRLHSLQLKTGENVTLAIGLHEQNVSGRIEYLSPIANPESNTVQVKIRIPNHDGRYPSGVSCRWDLDGTESAPVQTRVSRRRVPGGG